MLKILLLGIAFLGYQLSQAQLIIGFWEIKEVKVGADIMTPVAKWTKINPDGSYQSGNGWLQNAEGTWTFNTENKSYLPIETNGIVDKYGAFKVSFGAEQMIWERQEEGDAVIVKLERTITLPKSTADILVGLWDLKEILKNGKSEKSIFDPDNKHYLFIRWDRIYVERTPKGDRATGYWHINGHRPEVTFINQGNGKGTESWKVFVNDQELKMIGISDSNKNVEFIYERIKEFPN